jgi:NAD(P)-dependent dehydrogenase (short-subunit alcohol dehydrogenase family)
MREQGGGRIINFSDWVAKQRPAALSRLSSRTTSRKARVIALTEALALELAPRQHPRERDCAGPDRRAAGDDRRRAEGGGGRDAARPVGREMQIAKGVLALLESDFITGETIRIDGGGMLK